MLRLKEVRANRTLHELENGMAYYNYEGSVYSVFNSFEDGLKFLETRNQMLVISEFETEDELDIFLNEK